MSQPASKKVTIQQVAADCDVSLATVSRVINNSGPVKKETRRKILQSMYHLSYPGANAQNEKLLLVMLPNIENTFYASIIDGIESAAENHGFKFLIYKCGTRDYTYNELSSLVTSIHASGILFLNNIPDASLLEEIALLVPVIQCCEFNPQSSASYVSVDDYAATRTLMEYVITKGYRKIAIINSNMRYKYAKERLRGYTDVMNEHKLPIQQGWVKSLTDVSFYPAVSVATQMLSSDDPPEAVFAVSDIFAAAVIKAAKQLGMRIPGDVGVVGFDDTSISILSDPSITTINQPMYQMGYLACEILIDNIQSPAFQPQQVLLNTEIVVRNSL